MATRVVEGKKPYTGGTAIDIDENKVISLRLRDENNLIIYDEGDDEIYVDLQLPDEITPTDAFPIGVNTGRVVVDNGWDKAGTIISAKTTSGDVIKLVYADEGTLWIDNGTGTFKQIYFKSDVDAIITTLTTYINTELAKKQNGVASTTAPSNPSEGDLWYDTTNSAMKVWDGTAWQSVGTGGGSDIVYATQAEYNALLPGAESDGKHYFIYTPSVVPPWTPGANTVCYYPLDTDLNDASGNGYNLAGSNGAIIGTLNGVDCLDLSASNSYASVTISTIPQGNNVRTNMLWVYGNASGQRPAYQYGGSGNNKADVIYNIIPIGWSQYGGSLTSSVSAQGTRCHVAVVIKSDGQQEMFVNGNMVSLGSLTVNTTGTTLYLGHCTWDNTYLNGYISKFIVENKARTAQEILDYYNQTKGDYGIS